MIRSIIAHRVVHTGSVGRRRYAAGWFGSSNACERSNISSGVHRHVLELDVQNSRQEVGAPYQSLGETEGLRRDSRSAVGRRGAKNETCTCPRCPDSPRVRVAEAMSRVLAVVLAKNDEMAAAPCRVRSRHAGLRGFPVMMIFEFFLAFMMSHRAADFLMRLS